MLENALVDVDISEFVVSRRELLKRELVVFECLLSEASGVVDVVLKDSAYRSLTVNFLGYNDMHLPLVSVEVEFAVLV